MALILGAKRMDFRVVGSAIEGYHWIRARTSPISDDSFAPLK